jgi:hypothetical protein
MNNATNAIAHAALAQVRHAEISRRCSWQAQQQRKRNEAERDHPDHEAGGRS